MCLDINSVNPPAEFAAKNWNISLDGGRPYTKYFSCKGFNINKEWQATTSYVPNEFNGLTMATVFVT